MQRSLLLPTLLQLLSLAACSTAASEQAGRKADVVNRGAQQGLGPLSSTPHPATAAVVPSSATAAAVAAASSSWPSSSSSSSPLALDQHHLPHPHALHPARDLQHEASPLASAQFPLPHPQHPARDPQHEASHRARDLLLVPHRRPRPRKAGPAHRPGGSSRCSMRLGS